MEEITKLLQLEQFIELVERAAAGVLGVPVGLFEPGGELSAVSVSDLADIETGAAFSVTSGAAFPVTSGAAFPVTSGAAFSANQGADGADFQRGADRYFTERLAGEFSAAGAASVTSSVAGLAGEVIERQSNFFTERVLSGQNQSTHAYSERFFQEREAIAQGARFPETQGTNVPEMGTAEAMEQHHQSTNFFQNTRGATLFEQQETRLFGGETTLTEPAAIVAGERWRGISAAENRAVATEVTVNLGGVTNHVAAGVDLDEMVAYIGEKTAERLLEVAEGVHR